MIQEKARLFVGLEELVASAVSSVQHPATSMATLVKAEPKMGDSFCLFGVGGGRHGDESSVSAAPVDTEADLNFQNMAFFRLLRTAKMMTQKGDQAKGFMQPTVFNGELSQTKTGFCFVLLTASVLTSTQRCLDGHVTL